MPLSEEPYGQSPGRILLLMTLHLLGSFPECPQSGCSCVPLMSWNSVGETLGASGREEIWTPPSPKLPQPPLSESIRGFDKASGSEDPVSTVHHLAHWKCRWQSTHCPGFVLPCLCTVQALRACLERADRALRVRWKRPKDLSSHSRELRVSH